MPALRDFQQTLGQMVLGLSPDCNPALWVRDQDPENRLSIHRNNTRLGLTEVLASIYPVIQRLVGEEFFAMMAEQFLGFHPPRQSALLFWGQDFPAFVQGFAPARSLPDLADVARLESAWYRAYHAPESAPLDPRALLDIDPERLEECLLTLHPSMHAMMSPFPVLDIWAANQPDQDGTAAIDLNAGPACMLIVRPGPDVLVQAVTDGTFALVLALQCGQTLGTAWDAAKAVQADFSLVQALGALLSIGLFTKVTLS